jgi:ATP-dependent Clp protease ATP-binding subunit ClpA
MGSQIIQEKFEKPKRKYGSGNRSCKKGSPWFLNKTVRPEFINRIDEIVIPIKQ